MNCKQARSQDYTKQRFGLQRKVKLGMKLQLIAVAFYSKSWNIVFQFFVLILKLRLQKYLTNTKKYLPWNIFGNPEFVLSGWTSRKKKRPNNIYSSSNIT